MNRRRSWMIVPAHDAQAAMLNSVDPPDVVVLDLEYFVPPRCKAAARAGLAALINTLAAGPSEVFVRIDRDARWADVGAAVHRGIRGVVYPGAEQAEEIAEIDDLIAAKERERGVELGGTEIVLMLESAQGYWNAAELAQACPRVSALGVGRIDLTMQLGPVPQNEFRLYRFLMTRTLIAARMSGKQPLGALWRPGSRGGVAGAAATAQAARQARLMGFTGCVCATGAQVAPVNDGYSIA